MLDQARKSGYVRVRIDGNLLRALRGNQAGEETSSITLEIVVDRLIVKEGIEKRLHRFHRDSRGP